MSEQKTNRMKTGTFTKNLAISLKKKYLKNCTEFTENFLFKLKDFLYSKKYDD